MCAKSKNNLSTWLLLVSSITISLHKLTRMIEKLERYIVAVLSSHMPCEEFAIELPKDTVTYNT